MSGLVDRAALLERIDGDLEFLEETVELLETDGRSLVDQLRAACDAGNQEGLIRNAHTLKGMVSNFCADGVRRAAEEIEHAARRGELDRVPTKLQSFADVFDRLCTETRAILSNEDS